MGTINRSVWVDDIGDGITGTVINNSELQKIYDNIDAEIKSPTYPTIKTRDIIDQAYSGDEPYLTIIQTTATLTLNLAQPSRNYKISLQANVSSLVMTNLPSSSVLANITLRVDFAGAYTMVFPVATRWNQGITPVLTSISGRTDIFSFSTWDGGASWYGGSLGQNYTT